MSRFWLLRGEQGEEKMREELSKAAFRGQFPWSRSVSISVCCMAVLFIPSGCPGSRFSGCDWKNRRKCRIFGGGVGKSRFLWPLDGNAAPLSWLVLRFYPAFRISKKWNDFCFSFFLLDNFFPRFPVRAYQPQSFGSYL